MHNMSPAASIHPPCARATCVQLLGTARRRGLARGGCRGPAQLQNHSASRWRRSQIGNSLPRSRRAMALSLSGTTYCVVISQKLIVVRPSVVWLIKQPGLDSSDDQELAMRGSKASSLRAISLRSRSAAPSSWRWLNIYCILAVGFRVE